MQQLGTIEQELKDSIAVRWEETRRTKLRAILEFRTDLPDAYYHAHVVAGYSIFEMNAEFRRMAAERAQDIAETNFQRSER